MSSLSIRRLSPVDTEAYLALMRSGLRDHIESFRISAEDSGEPMVPFASNRPDAFTLGAWLEDNQLVGTVSFERETRVKFRHKGLLYRMYVHTDASGMGIGRRLIRETVARARNIEGLEQINLTVVASNVRAKHLYSSEGFKSFALEERGLKMGATYFDEEQMALRLFNEDTR
jgi:ribosomal protein S18 acetylase RimI-like enzyme